MLRAPGDIQKLAGWTCGVVTARLAHDADTGIERAQQQPVVASGMPAGVMAGITPLVRAGTTSAAITPPEHVIATSSAGPVVCGGASRQRRAGHGQPVAHRRVEMRSDLGQHPRVVARRATPVRRHRAARSISRRSNGASVSVSKRRNGLLAAGRLGWLHQQQVLQPDAVVRRAGSSPARSTGSSRPRSAPAWPGATG